MIGVGWDRDKGRGETGQSGAIFDGPEPNLGVHN